MPENTNQKLFVPEMQPPATPTPTKVEVPESTAIQVINFDELKANSVIVIKINPEGMQQRIAATQQIAMALKPFREQILAKSLAFLIMSTKESFDVIDEEQMKQIGWEKKEKSRIITL